MYTVYKTVCLVNDKFYIGVHKTADQNDSYLGSGKLLKRAIRKYGPFAFKKEILLVTDVAVEAFAYEAALVTLELVESDMCYNLKLGGSGGYDFINGSGKTSGKIHRAKHITDDMRRNASCTLRDRRENDPVFADAYSDVHRAKALRQDGFVGAFTGKSHSSETRMKISEAAKRRKSNSIGMMWINDGIINRKIPIGEQLPVGFIRGKLQRKAA